MPSEKTIAVILVDHGSRVDASNQSLGEVAAAFRAHALYSIVETAHMELAEPSLETAFERCLQQGAELIVVHPYFLAPGRHVSQDIPRLAAAAAAQHGDVAYRVSEPLGLHPALSQVIADRVRAALEVDESG